MSGLSRSFRKRAARELEMWVNQPFTSPLALGDIGTINGGRFDTAEATSLQQLGIAIGNPLVGQPQKLSWQSSDDSDFELLAKAQGEDVPGFSALAKADAGFRLTFGKKGSYLFETDEAVIERIDETEALHHSMVAARKAGKIRASDRIVVAVLKAKRARIYLSETRNTQIEVKASANFRSVVDAGVEFTLKRSRGSVLEINAFGDAASVIFMKLIRVRWLGGIDVVRLRGPQPAARRIESPDDAGLRDFGIAPASPLDDFDDDDDEG